MIPKTILQKEVWKLHHSLSEPREHEKFVISKHNLYYTTHYKNLVCLECNHMWKPELAFWQEELVGVKCPSCNKKLQKITINNGQILRIISYSVVQVVGRFQVVRYFSCWKNMYKDKKPNYYFRSLFEEWSEYEKNKKVIVGRCSTWTGDGFSSTDYEVRYNSSRWGGMTDYDRFASDFNCPGAEFLPRFKKYGLGKDFHNCDYRYLLRKLETTPRVETLLKAEQGELLLYAVHKDTRYNEFWPQIRILLRNKHKIKDAGIWYDYLQLLKEFGKDILNPKFILPKDLKKAHNEYVTKKQKKTAIENARRELFRQEKERNQAEQDKLLKNLKSEVFKDFSLMKGNMKIVTLIEEKDVKEEGKILKHCVHTNEYHKKSGILLMSARVDGKRMETIELSLATFEIIQSRGYDNNPTDYHDEIINLVRRNINKISKLVDEFKKKKSESVESEVAA